ncbi:MAG: hypothetical protein ABWZ79_15855 [Pedobacter agri]
MYLLGLDIGTSSIEVAVIDVKTQKSIATAQYPEHKTQLNLFILVGRFNALSRFKLLRLAFGKGWTI